MKCPRDGAQLSSVRIDGLELDRCVQCHGYWLDRGELEAICELHITDVEHLVQESVTAAEVPPRRVEGYMRCPRCPDGRLQRITYTFLHRVKVDRCDKCLGLWLDKSELDEIAGEKKLLDEQYSPRRLVQILHSTANLKRSG